MTDVPGYEPHQQFDFEINCSGKCPFECTSISYDLKKETALDPDLANNSFAFRIKFSK